MSEKYRCSQAIRTWLQQPAYNLCPMTCSCSSLPWKTSICHAWSGYLAYLVTLGVLGLTLPLGLDCARIWLEFCLLDILMYPTGIICGKAAVIVTWIPLHRYGSSSQAWIGLSLRNNKIRSYHPYCQMLLDIFDFFIILEIAESMRRCKYGQHHFMGMNFSTGQQWSRRKHRGLGSKY